LAQQQRLVLAGQAVDLAKRVVDTVGERVKAGSSSRAELTKAEIARAAAEIERERTSRALAAARWRLAANWGGTQPRFERADGNLASVHAVPDLEDLRRRLSQNPDLARWSAEISQRQAIIALERSRAVPDLMVGAGYRRLSGPDADALVAELSIPLPVFNRNQGAVLEARRRVAQAREEQRAAEVHLAMELSITHEVLTAAYLQVERLETAILPGAVEAFDTLRSGYLEGRFSYLDVLDAQRTLVAARDQHVRALAEYHQAVATVERLIGDSLNPDGSQLNAKGPIR
jgi:outer membrane protein, heavy metal efflux system